MLTGLREALRGLQEITQVDLRMIIYSLVIGVWHMPTLYDLALRDKFVHVLEHVTFFIVSLIFWWPIISPSRVVPKSGYGVQMIYILAVQIAMTPVFAYVTFSTDILYPTYEYAPRLIASMTPADDQLLAGVMMKIGGMVVSLVAFTIAFYKWYRAGEKEPDLSKRRVTRAVLAQ
jgi:putative membrane protein